VGRRKSPERERGGDSMRAFAAILIITITTIVTIGGAWICRGEFGIGPEWVLPILLAFVLPIKEKEQDDEHFKKRFREQPESGRHS
jgi:hypothetical protein